MKVELLYNSPLWVCSKAIRKCWASEDKSDTCLHNEIVFDIDGSAECKDCGYIYNSMHDLLPEAGVKDKELIERVGNKNKHASTLEHLVYTFDIDGISRACLQELARHRHASISVKSTRYTLKELKNTLIGSADFRKFVVWTDNMSTNSTIMAQLAELKKLLDLGVSNDVAKFALPEAYKTSLVWTVNARSLQNFLELRTNKAALWEIRELAYELYNRLPEEHKYLFFDSLYQDTKTKGQ